MPTFDTKTYISPFTWRYGSIDMRHIFSENHKYQIWRKIWVAVASVEKSFGLVNKEELEDLKKFQEDINIERILEIEKETKHDVVAAIKEFAEKAKIGKGKIHLGLTSMDVVDNTQAIQNKEGLELIEKKIISVLKLLSQKIEEYSNITCLGYTHLQPAEPTTVGYRFAFYAQDLLMDLEMLRSIKNKPLGKGIKGAVGTQASFVSLLGKKDKAFSMEQKIMDLLGIKAVDISTQVYTRKIDYMIVSLLSSVGSSIAKFASDLRILQSPMIGEWSEPFGANQVGSSAMPFKKNPINSEKICSLSRMVAVLPQVMLENATHSYLERTLDDSANKRIVVPEAFLIIDEILETAQKIIKDLIINKKRIAHNLSTYAPFLASEEILIKAVKNGGDRQKVHEILREVAMKSWDNVSGGKENLMQEMLLENKDLGKFISLQEITESFNVSSHIGTTLDRTESIVKKIKKIS